MAITSITIIQDNKSGDSNLVPIHSPVTFLCEVEYGGGIPPSFIYVDVLDKDLNLLDTLRCYKQSDQSSSLSTFQFKANDKVKSLMPKFDDFIQSNNTLVFDETRTLLLNLKFYDPDDALINDSVLINFVNAANQFGEEPNLRDSYFNFPETYFNEAAKPCYAYFFNQQTNTFITVKLIDVNGSTTVIFNQQINDVGFYRLKINPSIDAEIEFSTDGGEFYACIEVLDNCEGLYFKYLNHKGGYNFYNLNDYYKKIAKVSEIGSVEKNYSNILDAQSDRSNIGYNNSVQIQGTQEIPSSHLETLKDLYDSPRAYLKIGDGEEKKDWLEVKIKASENLHRRRRDNFGFIDFTISLPEQFSIKMI